MADRRLAAGPVLVIGYGSTLRGDDGIGPWIAHELMQDPTISAEVMACHQLTIDLAEPISRAGILVLVDAARGPVPGIITRRSVTPHGDQPQSMLHHMKPDALLAAAELLYGAAPPTTLWTITGQLFDYSDTLSPTVQQAAPEMLSQLTDFIRHHTKEGVML